MNIKLTVLAIVFGWSISYCLAQKGMEEMWGNTTAQEHANIRWFKDAKFGMFIHWGLYSDYAGNWEGKNYYGAGEWIMNRGKISVKEYRKKAETFNPVDFNADEWTQVAADAGMKYMVITAKHHDGFAMYDSKVSDFNIVKATPYKKDPMKALSAAARKKGIQFGFYYSQFQDWNEPNGGRNHWDFDESKKDYQQYYRQKAIPQLKELLTNYGSLGIIWFDTPGGMTKQQTKDFINELRLLQPKSLFSSRVGHGLGDYVDFGDSEIPAAPVSGAWESIFTHNDSWGYVQHDFNFKSSEQIIHILSDVASKGGNLMLNVGPDGQGNMPSYSVKYLKETGEWLKKNGESIYGSTYGFIPKQPWGVTTSKPGKLFLHVWNRPFNEKVLVPGFNNQVSKVYALVEKKALLFYKKSGDLVVDMSLIADNNNPNTVIVVEYSGKAPDYDLTKPITVSPQFKENTLDAVFAKTTGKAKVKKFTHSGYFGVWDHTTCVADMASPEDSTSFAVRITEPGDYKLTLEYSCAEEDSKQEGVLTIGGKSFMFETLRTAKHEAWKPMLFIKHAVAIFSTDKAGLFNINIRPYQKGKELFKLKTIIIEPIK